MVAYFLEFIKQMMIVDK